MDYVTRRLRIFVLSLVCICALLCGAASARAAVNEWSYVDGPGGGDIIAVAMDTGESQAVYARSASGKVFKSVDGGGYWECLGTIGGADKGYILINPLNPTTLYTGGSRSTDGGVTWTPLGTMINGRLASPSTLAMDPTTPATLYAGFDDGVYVSDDSGASWTKSGLSFFYDEYYAEDSAVALAVSKTTPKRVYVATSGGKIVRSDDGGVTWSRIGIMDTVASGIAVSPTDSNVVYVAGGGRIQKSVDGGVTWTSNYTQLGWINSFVIDAANGSNMYAAGQPGISKSTDGGETWVSFGTFGYWNVRALALNPKNQLLSFAGTDHDGVFKSGDNGESWTRSNNHLFAGNITSIAVNPCNTRELLVSSERVFRSTDAGASWTLIENLFPGLIFYAATGCETTPTVFVGGLKSVDGGDTWIGRRQFFPASMAINPLTAELYATDQSMIPYVSSDGGFYWFADIALFPIVNFNHLSASADGSVYASGVVSVDEETWQAGVFKRVNGVWSLLPTDGRYYNTVEVAAADPATVYAAGGNYVSKSTDSGQNWAHTVATTYPTNIRTITVDPANAAVAYIGTSSGVSRTIDGGATWAPYGSGLLADVGALDLYSDRLYLFALTKDGLYKMKMGTVAAAAPAQYGFGDTVIGAVSAANTFTITNTGAAAMEIGSVAMSGSNAFSILSETNTCNGIIPPGGSCSLQITFAPTAYGAATGVLSLTYNANANAPLEIQLNGNGLDIVPPVITLETAPGNPTGSSSASFSFSANEPSTFQCQVDAGAFVPCSSPVSYTGLADGAHTFTVTATDVATNPASLSYSWGIDTTPPVITPERGPGFYRDAPTITLMGNESATIYFTVDGTIPTPASPVYSAPIRFTPTTVLEFFGVDAVGNTSAVSAPLYTYLVSIDPADKEKGVQTNKSVVLTFSNDIKIWNAAAYDQIGLQIGNEPLIPCTVTISGARLTIVAKSALLKSTAYKVIVPAGALANMANSPSPKIDSVFTTGTL